MDFHVKDIKNNARVTVNNDFGVTSEAICQSFSRVTKSRMKIMANRTTSDPKIVITVINVLSYFLHAIWCPEQTIPLKQLSIADFAIVAKGSLFLI